LIQPTEAVPVSWFWKVLFFALPVYYFVAFARYGFTERDDGFVLALSWRVLLGEVPHRDFIYVRPPMPAYFHALILALLPRSIEIIGDRFLNYVIMAAANYFFFAGLSRWVPLQRFHLNVWVMSAIGFIYSMHNFPPMAWTTTDGIFFCALAFYLLTRGPEPRWLFFSMLAVIAGLLCKQSFVVMPPLAVLLIWQLYGWRRAAAAVGYAAAISLVLAAYAHSIGMLKPFLAQTTNTVGRGNVFVYAGLFPYFERAQYFYPLVGFLVMRFLAIRRPKWGTPLYGAFTVLVGCGLFWETIMNFTPLTDAIHRFKVVWAETFAKQDASIWRAVREAWAAAYTTLRSSGVWTDGHWYNIPYHAVRSLVWVGSIFTLLMWEPRRVPASLLPIYGIALAWSCSATNGYPTPALYSGPLAFAVFQAGANVLERRWGKIAMHAMLWGGLLTYSFANCFPYQSAPIWMCKKPMGQLFPKASFIYADDKEYDVYRELKELVAQYGTNFKTLPNVPLSNYLTDTRSPCLLDWVSDYELPGVEWQPVAQHLDRSGAVVFLRKNLMEAELLPYFQFGGMNSTVTYYVTKTWKRVESRTHFDVYVKDDQSTVSVEQKK